jgi:hypothetical protein
MAGKFLNCDTRTGKEKTAAHKKGAAGKSAAPFC